MLDCSMEREANMKTRKSDCSKCVCTSYNPTCPCDCHDGGHERIKPQHTPTPWRKILAPTQIVTDQFVVATLHNENSYANAEFILRAVNSHEELIMALRKLRRALDEMSLNPHDEFYNLAEIATDALAKAEGKRVNK